MTLQDMIDNFPGLSVDDLLKLNKAAANAWAERGDELRKSFKVGQRVTFLDMEGVRLFGTVAKIMRKNVKVEVNGRNWRVSPGVLTRA